MAKIFINIIFLSILLFLNSSVYAQSDSTRINYEPTNIGDSLTVKDSTKVIKKHKPFFLSKNYYEELSEFKSFSLSKKNIDKLDYRFTGDILTYMPYAFLNDFGYLGVPSELFLFDLSGNNTTIIEDNHYTNNRWNNFADLNRLQVENISTLSIVPLHRGFLYGNSNNNNTIILQANDSLKQKPITRIRYYQSNFDEAFIDASFGARVLQDLALSFRVTNAAKNDSYGNTSLGTWKAFVKASYKLNDSVLVSLKYNHLKLNNSINGGVDLTLLSENPLANIDTYSTKAPVKYYFLYNKISENRFTANIEGKILSIGNTKLTVSYSSNEDEHLHNPEKYNITTGTEYDSLTFAQNNYYNSFTAKFIHTISLDNFSSKIISGYDLLDYNLGSINYKNKLGNFYTSLIADYQLIKNLIKPSLFLRYSNNNKISSMGYGFDVTITPLQNLKFLIGYSIFDKTPTLIEAHTLATKLDQKNNSLFASLSYNKRKLNASLSYYNLDIKNSPFPIFNNGLKSLTESFIIFDKYSNVKNEGINLYLNSEIFNVLLFSNFNYCKSQKTLADIDENNFNLTAGIYYVDTLFNSNLDLKAGVNFYLFDKPENYYYDYLLMRKSKFYYQDNIIKTFDLVDVQNDKYKFDFVVAGTIRKAATFYFVFENFLDNKLFKIPYYPLPGRRIKLGIAWEFLD